MGVAVCLCMVATQQSDQPSVPHPSSICLQLLGPKSDCLTRAELIIGRTLRYSASKSNFDLLCIMASDTEGTNTLLIVCLRFLPGLNASVAINLEPMTGRRSGCEFVIWGRFVSIQVISMDSMGLTCPQHGLDRFIDG